MLLMSWSFSLIAFIVLFILSCFCSLIWFPRSFQLSALLPSPSPRRRRGGAAGGVPLFYDSDRHYLLSHNSFIRDLHRLNKKSFHYVINFSLLKVRCWREKARDLPRVNVVPIVILTLLLLITRAAVPLTTSCPDHQTNTTPYAAISGPTMANRGPMLIGKRTL